jgi:hypothetical protein
MQTAMRKNETILQWMYARIARLGLTAQGKCQLDCNIGFLINVRGCLRQVTVGAATEQALVRLPEQNHIYLILLRIACATHNLRMGVGARQRTSTYPKLLAPTGRFRTRWEHSTLSRPGSEFFGDHAPLTFR